VRCHWFRVGIAKQRGCPRSDARPGSTPVSLRRAAGCAAVSSLSGDDPWQAGVLAHTGKADIAPARDGVGRWTAGLAGVGVAHPLGPPRRAAS